MIWRVTTRSNNLVIYGATHFYRGRDCAEGRRGCDPLARSGHESLASKRTRILSHYKKGNLRQNSGPVLRTIALTRWPYLPRGTKLNSSTGIDPPIFADEM